MSLRRLASGVRGGGVAAGATLYSPTFVLLTATVCVSYLGVGFILPLRALYGQRLGASSFEIGLMASVALLTGFLAAPPIGALADRVGQRTVLWLGLLVHGFLVLAYIPINSPLPLIGLRGLEGIAIVGILPPARALMNAIAPPGRQGEALGVLGSAQMVGLMLGPALGTLLASQVGWAPAFLVAAAPLFAGAVLARRYLPAGVPHLRAPLTSSLPAAADEGRDVGPAPTGDEILPGAPATSASAPPSMLSRLFAPRISLAYGLTAALALTQGVISAIWAIYMRLRGASLELIGLSYTTFAITALILAPLAGRFSDRRGRFRPLVAALALYAVLYCLYAAPIGPWWLILLSGVEGISGAVARSATDGLLADVTPPDLRGRVQANYSAAGTAGAFLMALLAGLLYGASPGLPFLVVGIAFALVGAALLLLPPLRRTFPEFAPAAVESDLEAVERA